MALSRFDRLLNYKAGGGNHPISPACFIDYFKFNFLTMSLGMAFLLTTIFMVL